MDDRTYEGDAYAVLTGRKELVFFRSEKEYEDGEITLARDVLGNEYEGVVYSGVETKQWAYDDLPGWYGEDIRSARIADGQVIAPVSCAYWFHMMKNMVSCSLVGLDTSNVTSMEWMFHRCISLAAPPDTSRWDTSNVTDMSNMFAGCKSLQTPPDTSKWDTSRVEDMFCILCECESLATPPDTSKWDTSRVENVCCMFYGCGSLQTPPDTSGWDTSMVENMGFVFNGCGSLKTPPDVSGWDTSSVKDMSYVFDGCGNLEWIPNIRSQVKENHNR